VDAVGLQPHRRELQVDQDGHVDIDDDGVTDGHRATTRLSGQDLFDDRQAHDGVSLWRGRVTIAD